MIGDEGAKMDQDEDGGEERGLLRMEERLCVTAVEGGGFDEWEGSVSISWRGIMRMMRS